MGLNSSGLGISFFGDSGNVDAFGRLRVSEPFLVFDAQQKYDKLPLIFDEAISGAASSTFVTNESCVNMTVTTASGDSVVRQSKRYIYYAAGRSKLVLMTGNLGGQVTNVVQRIGTFDTQNGLFFQLDSTGLSVVQRSFTSGVAVDNKTAQANWNLDRLDGTGPSGVTLDPSKANIFFWDIEWLGVGRTRFGVVVNGALIYCHAYNNANALTTVYMTTAKLPLRYEITTTGTTSQSVTMKHICCSVIAEGGQPAPGIIRTTDVGISGKTTTSNVRSPILSIRLKSANIRASIQPVSYSIIPSGTNDIHYELVLNAALSGASFADIDGLAQLDTSATAASIVSGTSVVIDAGYFSGGNGATNVTPEDNVWWVAANIAGTSDTLTLCATPIGTAPKIYGSLTYREIT